MKEVLDKLSSEDRALADAQGICPITGKHLGSMGVPVKIDLNGRMILLCCPLCVDQAKANPQRTLDKVDQRENKAKDATPAK